MLPGLGGMNPKKMQGMMKQLGINQEEIPSNKVTIEKTDGSLIIIENPSVQKITMQGQESFQISGHVREDTPLQIKPEDITLVMEKTSKSEDEARTALESSNGDIAEAIMALSN